MTIDEAIQDFEKEWPDFAWTIDKLAYINGKFQGYTKARISVKHPLSSSSSSCYYVICERDNIPAGFLELKRILEAKEPNWNETRKVYGYE